MAGLAKMFGPRALTILDRVSAYFGTWSLLDVRGEGHDTEVLGKVHYAHYHVTVFGCLLILTSTLKLSSLISFYFLCLHNHCNGKW